MTQDPRWSEIYSQPQVADTYAPPPVSVPRVRPGAQTCDDHCSGNHHVDSVLRCPSCKTVAYRIWAHEWLHHDGHYFFAVEPMNGSPTWDGRGDPPMRMCRICEVPWDRQAA